MGKPPHHHRKRNNFSHFPHFCPLKMSSSYPNFARRLDGKIGLHPIAIVPYSIFIFAFIGVISPNLNLNEWLWDSFEDKEKYLMYLCAESIFVHCSFIPFFNLCALNKKIIPIQIYRGKTYLKMELLPKVYKSLNTFSVYGENNTQPMHTNYEHSFALPFEHLNNSMEVTLALQHYWHWSFFLSIFYYFSIRLIQSAMRNRKPFELRIPLLIWNSSLALFSLVALIRFGEDALHQYLHHGLVHTICYSCHPNRVAAFWAFLFLISKVVEMGDTVFLALRKRPIIFLHFYHHMAVLVCSTHVGADNAAPAMLFIPMNFFVHIFMYSYYALMTAGVKVPRWCAMSITSMQTLQMLCGVALTAFVLKLKIVDQIKCQQSYGNLSLIVFLYITFAFLFSHLFYDHYLKKGGKMAKKQHQNGNGVMANKKKA